MQARRQSTIAASGDEEKKTEVTSQADDLIAIRQLRGRRAATAVEVDLDDEADITKGSQRLPVSPVCVCVCVCVCVFASPCSFPPLPYHINLVPFPGVFCDA